jgi:hypothetical protein
MQQLAKPAPEDAVVTSPANQSIIKDSAILHDDKNWTIVPKGAVVFLPIADIRVVTLDPDGKVPRTRVELLLNDLYPRSDTSFMIYKGAAVNTGTGILVESFPMDRDAAESTVIRVDELDSKLTEDGTSTLALMSDTVFGTEFLCPPVTFQVKRSLQVNAMQVSYSDSNQP